MVGILSIRAARLIKIHNTEIIIIKLPKRGNNYKIQKYRKQNYQKQKKTA
jgi:hypothetical protein